MCPHNPPPLPSQSGENSCERVILEYSLVDPLDEMVSEASLEIAMVGVASFSSETGNGNIAHKLYFPRSRARMCDKSQVVPWRE